MSFHNTRRHEQRVRCERCHFPTRVNPPIPPPPPPPPRPVTHPATTPKPPIQYVIEDELTPSSLIICLGGAVVVFIYITCFRGDVDPMLKVFAMFPMLFYGFFLVVGVVGFLGSLMRLLLLYRKEQAAAGKTVATAVENDVKQEAEADEKVEEDDQQEMVELLSTQRGYATFDDIV